MAFRDIIQAFKNAAGNLKTVWNLVTHLYDVVRQMIDHVLTLFVRIETLIRDVEHEINEIEHFTFDTKWKTRVISAPKALEKMRRLGVDIPREISTAIRDLVRLLKEKVNSAEISDDVNVEELEADLKLVPEKLARCGEKLLGWVTLIFDAIKTISDAVDDLQTVVNDFREVREDFEHLDLIFLQNRNPRRKVDITYRKRV